MAFITATYAELAEDNPNRTYRMLANGSYVLENEAIEIILGERDELSIAYAFVSNNTRDPLKTLLSEIKNKSKLSKLSDLVGISTKNPPP
tara:strand:- start:82 stop:351 length:270 start_codon:yes stop_codon:yes gene_type:complete